MIALISVLKKLGNIRGLVQGVIDERNKKKQDKEADKIEKKFNQDTQGLDSEGSKDTLTDDIDIGDELAKIIEEAMSEHDRVSAEMQESIDALRGFAPDPIDYPNDTQALVKDFTDANGGKMDASIAALRNTGYLMEGQQQIGQTVQLTGQAVAGIAQNMGQSIQTTMQFMQEVPETIRETAENSHEELEEFLKKWQKGQERQFKFLQALKGIASWPLKVGKFTISKTEQAMIRAQIIQKTLAEVLGKTAAFKVIFNNLAKKFPLVAKIQKGFYNVVNFIPTLTGYLTDTFKEFKGNLKYIGFEIKGNLLNLGNKSGFVKKDTLSPEDTHLLDDWEAIHGSKELQKQRSKVAKKGAGAIEQLQKYHGFDFTEEEVDAIRAGDSSVFIDKVRKQAKLDDKEWRPLLELEQLARDLIDEDSTFNYTLGKETSDNIWGRIQDLIYAKKSTGKNLPELYKAVLDEISKESLKAHGNQNKLQALTTINNLIQELNKDKHLSGHGKVMDYDSMSTQRILADYYGVGALTDAYQYTYEADKLKTQENSQDNEKLQKALDNQGLEFDENGKIVTKDRNKLGFKERQEQAYEKSIKGTEELENLMGAPKFGVSRRENFIQQMINKYHLDYQKVYKEFKDHPDLTKDNAMFYEWTAKGKDGFMHTYVSIREPWFKAWCKAHPEVGFKEPDKDMIDISVDNDGTNIRAGNQGTNAYREFDADGKVADVKPTSGAKKLPTPSNDVADVPSGGDVVPKKADVDTTPSTTEGPTEEEIQSTEKQSEKEEELSDEEKAQKLAKTERDFQFEQLKILYDKYYGKGAADKLLAERARTGLVNNRDIQIQLLRDGIAAQRKKDQETQDKWHKELDERTSEGDYNPNTPTDLDILDAKTISDDVIDPVSGKMLKDVAKEEEAQKQAQQKAERDKHTKDLNAQLNRLKAIYDEKHGNGEADAALKRMTAVYKNWTVLDKIEYLRKQIKLDRENEDWEDLGNPIYGQDHTGEREALIRQEQDHQRLAEAAQEYGMDIGILQETYDRLHKTHGTTVEEYLQTIKDISDFKDEVIEKGDIAKQAKEQEEAKLTKSIDDFKAAVSGASTDGQGIKGTLDRDKEFLAKAKITWDKDKNVFIKTDQYGNTTGVDFNLQTADIQDAMMRFKARQAWAQGKVVAGEDEEFLSDYDKEQNSKLAELLEKQERTHNDLAAIAALVKSVKDSPSVVFNNTVNDKNANGTDRNTALNLLDMDLDKYTDN